MIVAVANQKGGVGKTTTAINLGGYLALRGQRVLLIDMDPQGNAATCLGVHKRDLEYTVGEVLLGEIDAPTAVVGTGRPNYGLIAAVPDLAGTAVALATLPERETRLRKAIEPLTNAYDVILIDCPPSLGLLTVNGLTAADQVLIPLQCEFLALEGLAQLKETVELVRSRLNSRLRIGGVVMTMYDGRANLARQVVEEVRRYFPQRIYNTLIPRNIRLSEAPSYGELISEYDAQSRGAKAYAALAEEMLAREEALR